MNLICKLIRLVFWICSLMTTLTNMPLTNNIVITSTKIKNTVKLKPVLKHNFHISDSVGCRHRKNIKIITPQYEDCDRPSPLFGNAFVKTNAIFQCKYCSRTAKCKSTMEDHVRRHFPPKYPCDQCGDGFYSSTARFQHYLHRCSHCLKIFRGHVNCGIHQKRCRKNPNRMVKQTNQQKKENKLKNYTEKCTQA